MGGAFEAGTAAEVDIAEVVSEYLVLGGFFGAKLCLEVLLELAGELALQDFPADRSVTGPVRYVQIRDLNPLHCEGGSAAVVRDGAGDTAVIDAVVLVEPWVLSGDDRLLERIRVLFELERHVVGIVGRELRQFGAVGGQDDTVLAEAPGGRKLKVLGATTSRAGSPGGNQDERGQRRRKHGFRSEQPSTDGHVDSLLLGYDWSFQACTCARCTIPYLLPLGNWLT
jgi:hypothetical protein